MRSGAERGHASRPPTAIHRAGSKGQTASAMQAYVVNASVAAAVAMIRRRRASTEPPVRQWWWSAARVTRSPQPDEPRLVEEEIPEEALPFVDLRPAFEREVDGAQQMERLGRVRDEPMCHCVDRARERGHYQEPAWYSKAPWPHERQRAQAERDDEASGEQAGGRTGRDPRSARRDRSSRRRPGRNGRRPRTRSTRCTQRRPCGPTGTRAPVFYGRYWARTSDPQLVEVGH
jgi:hypothetical protein